MNGIIGMDVFCKYHSSNVAVLVTVSVTVTNILFEVSEGRVWIVGLVSLSWNKSIGLNC